MYLFPDDEEVELQKPPNILSSVHSTGRAYTAVSGIKKSRIIFFNCSYSDEYEHYLSQSAFHSRVNTIMRQIKSYWEDRYGFEISKSEISDGVPPTSLSDGEVLVNIINLPGRSNVGGRIGRFFNDPSSETSVHEFGHFLGLTDRYTYSCKYDTSSGSIMPSSCTSYICKDILVGSRDPDFITNYGWTQNIYSDKGDQNLCRNYKKICACGSYMSLPPLTPYQQSIVDNPQLDEPDSGISHAFLLKISNPDSHQKNTKNHYFSFMGFNAQDAPVCDYKKVTDTHYNLSEAAWDNMLTPGHSTGFYQYTSDSAVDRITSDAVIEHDWDSVMSNGVLDKNFAASASSKIEALRILCGDDKLALRLALLMYIHTNRPRKDKPNDVLTFYQDISGSQRKRNWHTYLKGGSDINVTGKIFRDQFSGLFSIFGLDDDYSVLISRIDTRENASNPNSYPIFVNRSSSSSPSEQLGYLNFWTTYRQVNRPQTAQPISDHSIQDALQILEPNYKFGKLFARHINRRYAKDTPSWSGIGVYHNRLRAAALKAYCHSEAVTVTPEEIAQIVSAEINA